MAGTAKECIPDKFWDLLVHITFYFFLWFFSTSFWLSRLKPHDYTSISSSAVVHQREGVGYYGLGVDQQRAYLSACINPQGNSRFTYEQFNKNRYLYETRPQHILSWLLGQEQLQDRRCLWTHLSIPLKDSSPEATYPILEKAWFSWEQWWRPRFPKP